MPASFCSDFARGCCKASPCNKPHVPACKFFQMGTCKHGDGALCKFAHVSPAPGGGAGGGGGGAYAPAPAADPAGAGVIATHDYLSPTNQPSA